MPEKPPLPPYAPRMLFTKLGIGAVATLWGVTDVVSGVADTVSLPAPEEAAVTYQLPQAEASKRLDHEASLAADELWKGIPLTGLAAYLVPSGLRLRKRMKKEGYGGRPQ